MRTKGEQAAAIANAVVYFLKQEGYLDLGDLPADIQAKLIEVIFRAA